MRRRLPTGCRRVCAVNRGRLPYVCTTLGTEPVCALLDSGSGVSLISYNWYRKYKRIARLPALDSVTQSCFVADGRPLNVIGQAKFKLSIQGFSWPLKCLVVKGLSVKVILGYDFLQLTRCLVDYGGGKFYFKFRPDRSFKLCSHGVGSGVHNTSIQDAVPDVSHLSEDQASQLIGLLREFPEVFTDRLGVTNKIEYRIQLTDQNPVRQTPYRLSPPKMKKLREIVDKLLADGVIRPSVSPYAAPIFLVPKPHGEGFRPVVDYRALNQKVVLESVPLPELHNCFTWFAGARYFTVLDLNQAYYQIPLAEESKPITAFCTDYNLFEFNRVPFGLATGAAVLSRLLDSVLGDFKFKFLYNYLDDVVVYSTNFEDHISHLRQVFARLKEAGLTVKPTKVTLAREQISFLGHIVSSKGVAVDQSRTLAIQQFPVPRNKRAIARFVGMINYFRKYIPNFAQLAAPINQLRRKGVKFSWGESQQAAFDGLKKALSTAPVLGIPDFNLPFIVQTDASNVGVAAVLLQEQGERRPLAYASRALSVAEAKYSVYELEALAVLFALEKFKFYLEHARFRLETDNQALSWVLARPRKTGRIARWAVRISAFQFDVVHIRGGQNQIADALSRMFQEEEDASEAGPQCEAVGMIATLTETPSLPTDDREEQRRDLESHCLYDRRDAGEDDPGPRCEGVGAMAILTEIPSLFTNLREEQRQDPELQRLLNRLDAGESVPGYCKQKGLLCFQARGEDRPKLCVPSSLVPAVFKYFHQSLCGGHLGYHKTRLKIREQLTWRGLDKDIRQLVRDCETCCRAKPKVGPRAGFLESTREYQPMDKLFIDYLGPLPRTKGGKRFVLVVIDAFTRFVWLVPSSGITAGITVQHLRRIFASFGPPKAVVSDNAPAFTSKEFRRFCFELGIRHITTTPYYPQPSFAERFNRNLKAALIAYHSTSQKRWDSSLDWLAFAFNTANHEAHKTTPAKLMFSYPVNSPLANIWSLADLLPEQFDAEQIKRTWEAAKRNIKLAHHRQKGRYDQGRRAVNIAVGDKVFLQNYRGLSQGSQGITSKLLPRFVGPLLVLKRLSPVNFLLRDVKSGKKTRAHLNQIKRGGTAEGSGQPNKGRADDSPPVPL